MIRFYSTYSFCDIAAKTAVCRSLEQDLETGLSLSLYDPIMRERIALHGFLALGLVLSACAKDDNPSASSGEEIRFSAYKNRVVTRSGDGWSPFDAGTKYDLYIIDYAATPDWTEGNALLYNGTGTETPNGTIDYGTPVQFPAQALNFYAVTDGTATKPVASFLVGSAPAYEVKVDENDRLADLMRAEVIGRDAATGSRVELDFIHTLSKIRFEIAKQTDDAPMNDIYIQSVTLENMYAEGTLNLQTGMYALGSPAETRAYYDRSAAGDKQYIGLSQAGIKSTDGTTDLEMLIFPRDAANMNVINVRVVLGKDGESDAWKTVDVPVEYIVDAETNLTEPFEFKPNYEYVLTLMVTDNTVRLLIFETQVYEWIEVDHDEDEIQASLGKPISFAGIMWMDRNLGAKSADPINDFDNCTGYYYQHGRSIPYLWNSQKNIVYTYGSNGEIIEGYVAYAASRTESAVAWMPGEVPADTGTGDPSGYKYIRPTTAGEAGRWLLGDNASGGSSIKMQTFWNDKNNQPCPDGWRMPVPADIAAFMPSPSLVATWHTAPSGSMTGREFNRTNILNAKEDRIYGTIGGVPAIYMLKNKGTNKAYRIRIERLESNKPNHYYYQICRFPAESSDDFSGYTQTTIAGAYDWNYPSEIMNIACSGLINLGTISLVGNTVMLRTSAMGTLPGGSAVCYFITSNSNTLGPGMQPSHGACQGSQIRCVRDLNEQ